MKVGDPDVEALRALFAELEFTSLLKELLPVVEVKAAITVRSRRKLNLRDIWKA